jgi:hypothetical protein
MKILNSDGSIAGWFINTTITFTYLILIVVGVFYTPVCDNIKNLDSFMTWFFVASFGIWSTKKTIEFVMGDKTIKISDPDSKP